MTAATIVISSVRLAVLHHFRQQLCLVSSKYLFFFLNFSANHETWIHTRKLTHSDCAYSLEKSLVCAAQVYTSPQLSFQKENVKSENGFNCINLCEVINLFLVVAKMMKSRKSFKNIVRTVVNPKSTEAYENSIGRSQGYLYVLFISCLLFILFSKIYMRIGIFR